MDLTIQPQLLRGEITIIPSKSVAHRLLICAALADKPTELICPDTNRDIEATAECLRALGAGIVRTSEGYEIDPISQIPKSAVLPCHDSGSTLRFLLPVVGALGVDATFRMSGRLPQRPLSPLWEEMRRMGCILTRPRLDTIRCTGKLQPGTYTIDGGVSSQFITGLLFALSLIPGESHLEVSGKVESKPYIDLTKNAMALFAAPRYHSPGCLSVEGDWSNAAFFLTAAMLGSELTILGLDNSSAQGDRAVVEILEQLRSKNCSISAADIPDLIPILSVAAASWQGAVFTDIQRLRLKESDRVEATIHLITSLGGKAEATESTLTVHAAPLTGGIVDAKNDHRIAMAAAIGATVSKTAVTICGAECVEKSYPKFWEEYRRLGGQYEQHIR